MFEIGEAVKRVFVKGLMQTGCELPPFFAEADAADDLEGGKRKDQLKLKADGFFSWIKRQGGRLHMEDCALERTLRSSGRGKKYCCRYWMFVSYCSSFRDRDRGKSKSECIENTKSSITRGESSKESQNKLTRSITSSNPFKLLTIFVLCALYILCQPHAYLS